MKRICINIFGWYGTIAIILAYALLSFSIISSTSLSYQLLNLTGALGIVVEAYSKKDYQPTVLNIVWFLVALIAVINIVH